MNFERLKERHGFGLAVVFSEKLLPKEFWEKLNFSQWLEIGQRAVRGTDLEFIALENMIRLAKRPSELFVTWQFACKKDCPYRQRVILNTMNNTEANFDDWFEVFDTDPEGSKPQLIALKKISGIVSSAEGLALKIELSNKMSSESIKMEMTFEEVADRVGFGLAVYILEKKLPLEFWEQLTRSQWIEIYIRAPDRSDLKKRALEGSRINGKSS